MIKVKFIVYGSYLHFYYLSKEINHKNVIHSVREIVEDKFLIRNLQLVHSLISISWQIIKQTRLIRIRLIRRGGVPVLYSALFVQTSFYHT